MSISGKKISHVFENLASRADEGGNLYNILSYNLFDIIDYGEAKKRTEDDNLDVVHAVYV